MRPWTEAETEELCRLRQSGAETRQITTALGRPRKEVYRRIAKLVAEGREEEVALPDLALRRQAGPNFRRPPSPTPEEIRIACAAIKDEHFAMKRRQA